MRGSSPAQRRDAGTPAPPSATLPHSCTLQLLYPFSDATRRLGSLHGRQNTGPPSRPVPVGRRWQSDPRPLAPAVGCRPRTGQSPWSPRTDASQRTEVRGTAHGRSGTSGSQNTDRRRSCGRHRRAGGVRHDQRRPVGGRLSVAGTADHARSGLPETDGRQRPLGERRPPAPRPGPEPPRVRGPETGALRLGPLLHRLPGTARAPLRHRPGRPLRDAHGRGGGRPSGHGFGGVRPHDERHPLIVVLGHQRCGAVEASYKSLRDGKPLPGNLEAIARALRPAYEQTVREGGGGDPVDTMARAQVKLTAANLRSNQDLAPSWPRAASPWWAPTTPSTAARWRSWPAHRPDRRRRDHSGVDDLVAPALPSRYG